MSRKKTLSRKKKIALLAGAAALVAGTAVVMTGTSQASVACDGLATAVSNNEQFIAGQRANPDAQSNARIANREAVIAQIRRQQEASGCDVAAPPDDAQAPPAEETAPPAEGGAGAGNGAAPGDGAGADAGAGAGAGDGAVGEVVCAGSTVTLSGEAGAPAASSGEFPVGTRLKVTNLDNNKSTTVEVTSASGSCALLNNAAFEQVREPGKFLIRKARIERVG
ncbi:hypothetical protein AR457_24740 [Streptomyces agglomeratus]|uniref:hypothetical protein n=1 Tax=Streptomyces agglomeratus TaxID=285458 RepID=UPI000854B5D3|nr:hypothetical protein [Streptomyces agglomeratus]OEJ38765.1 hypothetical protein BGK70_11915 [Streptomyces agglomeratus]OEJ46850.1 hypothetical protein AR457_24740 [Streptomyces agglomeratus]OEJ58662.1 hypothetical protein BGM19_12305 [Streptomyces agglomeratus]